MFAKPAFLLRSLFAAAVVSSLVACTFDGAPGEDEKGSTSALHRRGSDVDASADDDAGPAPTKGHDGGAYDSDASVDLDGGAYDPDASWGWGDDDDADGGAWDDSWDTDAGAGWGSDAG